MFTKLLCSAFLVAALCGAVLANPQVTDTDLGVVSPGDIPDISLPGDFNFGTHGDDPIAALAAGPNGPVHGCYDVNVRAMINMTSPKNGSVGLTVTMKNSDPNVPDVTITLWAGGENMDTQTFHCTWTVAEFRPHPQNPPGSNAGWGISWKLN